MSDVDLLVFGCVVTFVGVAGAYAYIRESFTSGAKPPRKSKARNPDAVKHEISEVA